MSKTVVKAAGISLSDTFAFTGTVTGASDIVLIKTVTVSSSVSSVEFKDGVDGVVFDNTYTNYKVIGSDVDNTSSDAELLGQISSDTGSSYKTSGYRGTSFQAYNNGSNSGTAQDNWTNGIPLLKNMDNNTTETGYFEWSINNPSTSSLQPLLSISAGRDSDTTAYANLYLSAGFYNDAAIVVDAVKISATAGNLDGGVFKLYGYK